ncbi:MAG TPA: hypothetical protein VGF38_09000 [Ktedonobacterales bacterium]
MTNQTSASTDAFRSRLAALLRQAHADERAVGDMLTPEERERTGTVDAWTPKEVIVHNAYWREREIERAEARLRGEALPSFAEYLRMNTESFADLATHSWDQAIARALRATEDLIAAMERLPDSALVATAGTGDGPEGVVLLTSIISNGYQHPEEHLAEIAAARGDQERAAAIQRRILDGVVALDVGAEVTATVRYNLACALAAHGPRAEVMTLLRQSFADSPRLITLSRQDTDLDPLRDDPDFQALIAEEQA